MRATRRATHRPAARNPEAPLVIAATFGEDLWTYGLEPNRPVLAAALRHACADGLAGPELTPDDLFR